MLKIMFTAAAMLLSTSFSASVSAGEGISPGTYLGKGFGGNECGRLVIRQTGRHAYVAGICNGNRLVQTNYTARSVKYEELGNGKYLIKIDRARFHVSKVKSNSISGRWVLGDFQKNIVFKH